MRIYGTSYKSQLAKLLASENIFIEHRHDVSTASFDLKNRVLILPVWQGISLNVYDMFIYHEVGHAIDTPPGSWKLAIETLAKEFFGVVIDSDEKNERSMYTYAFAAQKMCGHFLNVVEDVRIDRLQKTRYPGCKKSYVKGLKDLHEMDFFKIEEQDIDINELSFIDRANLYYKGGDLMNIRFDDTEREFIKRMYTTKSWDDVYNLTEEIMRHTLEKDKDKIEDELERLRMILEGSMRLGITVENYDASMRNHLEESDGEEVVYANIPEPNLDKIIVHYKDVIADAREFKNKLATVSVSTFTRKLGRDIFSESATSFLNWKEQENASISYMIKEFESLKAARDYAKTSISKTGVIDMNRIHTYLYNDDVFKRNTIVPKGKNHGFIFFIDWSSSMTHYIHETLKHMFSIVMFCRRLNIPFDVYTFTNYRHNGLSTQFKYETNDLDFGNDLSLRHMLSSSMNAADLNEMMQFFWTMTDHTQMLDQDGKNGMSGTPLNAAVVAAVDIAKEFRRRYKTEILNLVFLTDGESNYIEGVFGKERDSSKNRYDQLVIKDKESKNVFTVESKRTSDLTEALYQYLQFKVECNVIGFHLLRGSAEQIYTSYQVGGDEKHRNLCLKLWNDENFMPILGTGMNEKYMINVDALRHEYLPTSISISSRDDNDAIAKKFQSYMDKRKVKKILLRRFVTNISKDI